MSRLAVTLNRLKLANPILVASGTFGYAREMQSFTRLSRLGGIIPKTVTPLSRIGNPPPRTFETAGGMLNSIGLDNDGLDAFIEKHLDWLLSLGTSLIVNIAGRNVDEFVSLARRLDEFPRIAALELNISCPNVSGGVDFGTDPQLAAELVGSVRAATRHPVIAKLTPNVTSIVSIAEAAAAAGADAVSLVNTFQGLAVDWHRRRPILGNGGLWRIERAGIKPLALRAVCQVARAVRIPVIGVGGIASIDDVMDYLVCGASAVQVGTANFYDPGVAERLVDQLEQLMDAEGWRDLREVIGTLQAARCRLIDLTEACCLAERTSFARDSFHDGPRPGRLARHPSQLSIGLLDLSIKPVESPEPVMAIVGRRNTRPRKGCRETHACYSLRTCFCCSSAWPAGDVPRPRSFVSQRMGRPTFKQLAIVYDVNSVGGLATSRRQSALVCSR